MFVKASNVCIAKQRSWRQVAFLKHSQIRDCDFPFFDLLYISLISLQKVRFTKFPTKLPKTLSWDNISTGHRRQLSNVKFLTEIFQKKGVLLTNTINMIRILQENTKGEIDMRKFINRKKSFPVISHCTEKLQKHTMLVIAPRNSNELIWNARWII